MRGRTTLLLTAFLLFFLSKSYPQSPFLSIELSEELSLLGFDVTRPEARVLPTPSDWQAVQDRAVDTLLEESRWIFSGMIYGFRFRYVPGAVSLEVEDTFELEPLSLIPRGAAGLRVEQVRGDYSGITIQFSYWLDEGEKKRIARYRGSGFFAAGGAGSAEIMEESARITSMRSAVKQALREDLRQRYYNRPREISGFLVFSHSPQIRLGAGSYNASVRILYNIEELREYPSGS